MPPSLQTGPSEKAGPSQQAGTTEGRPITADGPLTAGMPIISAARMQYLPFYLSGRTTVPTTRSPQLPAATMPPLRLPIIATGIVITAATDGTTLSGSSSGGGIAPADEDDGSLSNLLASCGHIEQCQG